MQVMYICLFVCILISQVLSGCPYSDGITITLSTHSKRIRNKKRFLIGTLKKWSIASSWPSNSVPAANSDVTIPAGIL